MKETDDLPNGQTNGLKKNMDKKSWLKWDLILSDFKKKGCLHLENSPIVHLKYLYFDVSLYFYYTCPGATDSVNLSEVDSVVENFVRDALSQCDQSTVSETSIRVH